MHNPAPCRHSSDSSLLAVDSLPVHHATICIDIHLRGPQPSTTLPEVATNPEHQHDWQRKVGLEEGLGRGWIATKRVESDGKLDRNC